MLSKITMRKEQKIPELITLKEACAILKVHPNTLRQWDKKRLLVAIRIGEKRVRRYKKIDIEKFINQKNK
ncbi:MAG: helix-turn-helix domain-containing protein [Patescibacteria group bacterium]|nr:helix-turn-helix domain-containing protein [Patescibacteria group bacterium]